MGFGIMPSSAVPGELAQWAICRHFLECPPVVLVGGGGSGWQEGGPTSSWAYEQEDWLRLGSLSHQSGLQTCTKAGPDEGLPMMLPIPDVKLIFLLW